MDMQTCPKIDTDPLTQWQYCLLKTRVDNLTGDITLLTNREPNTALRLSECQTCADCTCPDLDSGI